MKAIAMITLALTACAHKPTQSECQEYSNQALVDAKATKENWDQISCWLNKPLEEALLQDLERQNQKFLKELLDCRDGTPEPAGEGK